MSRTRILLVVAVAFTAVLFITAVSNDVEAKANKVKVIDACDINEVFCAPDGSSDLPDFISGFAIFNPTRDGTAMITVMVKGSVPDAIHRVHLCPGVLTDLGGFDGCSEIGTFTANINGHGAFHMDWPFIHTGTVVAINVHPFATILANCPAQWNADCTPDPLQ